MCKDAHNSFLSSFHLTSLSFLTRVLSLQPHPKLYHTKNNFQFSILTFPEKNRPSSCFYLFPFARAHLRNSPHLFPLHFVSTPTVVKEAPRRRLRALRVRLRRIYPPLRFGAYPLRRCFASYNHRLHSPHLQHSIPTSKKLPLRHLRPPPHHPPLFLGSVPSGGHSLSFVFETKRGTPMRTIVNRLSQSDSAEAWKQVMSVSYSRSADCICLAYYNALTEVLPVPRIL